MATTTPTRIQFKRGETYLVDALRYPASVIQGAPTVLLLLLGGPADKQEIRRLALRVAGETGLSLDTAGHGDLLVVGISAEQAEWGADRLVAEIQAKLDAMHAGHRFGEHPAECSPCRQEASADPTRTLRERLDGPDPVCQHGCWPWCPSCGDLREGP